MDQSKSLSESLDTTWSWWLETMLSMLKNIKTSSLSVNDLANSEHVIGQTKLYSVFIGGLDIDT